MIFRKWLSSLAIAEYCSPTERPKEEEDDDDDDPAALSSSTSASCRLSKIEIFSEIASVIRELNFGPDDVAAGDEALFEAGAEGA